LEERQSRRFGGGQGGISNQKNAEQRKHLTKITIFRDDLCAV